MEDAAMQQHQQQQSRTNGQQQKRTSFRRPADSAQPIHAQEEYDSTGTPSHAPVRPLDPQISVDRPNGVGRSNSRKARDGQRQSPQSSSSRIPLPVVNLPAAPDVPRAPPISYKDPYGPPGGVAQEWWWWWWRRRRWVEIVFVEGSSSTVRPDAESSGRRVVLARPTRRVACVSPDSSSRPRQGGFRPKACDHGPQTGLGAGQVAVATAGSEAG